MPLPASLTRSRTSSASRSPSTSINEPGSLYYPRYNQVDLNLKKNFRYGSKTYSGQIDFFNLLNGNAIFARQDAVGNSLGDVTTILQGRLIRLAFQMKF